MPDSLVPTTELSQPPTPRARSASVDNMSRHESPDRVKFVSPAPPTASSMTPPPSSQLPIARPSSIVRTPTPSTPQLSSPPPTSKLPDQPSALTEPAAALFLPDQIDNALPDELRAMVHELTSVLKDVRLSAAHYKLQYNMAVMESQESASRMAVELAMAQRELDVLQQAEEKRRATMPSPVQSFQETPADTANAIMVTELSRQCHILQNENDELRDELEHQKRRTEHQKGELSSLMEENDRLKTRIRRNRDHIAPFLPYLEQVNEQSSPRSLFGTPQQPTPRNRVSRVPPSLSTENSRGQHNFEALLLADKMLSQETATAPSTPTRSHAPRSRFGHTRGTHSMSSVPHTPNRRSAHLQASVPRTPPAFSAVNVPQSAPPAHYQPKPAHIRRESSNSTITASSVDEEEAFTDREEVVGESQASQLATSMLRTQKKPKQNPSAPSSQSQSQSQPQSQSNLIQSKIYGQVKKGGLTRPTEFEKRRLQSGEHGGSPSKQRRLDPSMGLGIEYLHR
ncbi:hypothetical protein BS50DRAFT_483937 [Corynespora cassiicola Philippines]|uniref:Uncharacterized protein n=1 Tax=Corynespora cassiicola Philippines TaxID=1448308 RepID=A0A2T2P3H0_CORCC|nr:hypothetical protein BS50DRAFT_483937 [Corynespora cassiicola Philippines]